MIATSLEKKKLQMIKKCVRMCDNGWQKQCCLSQTTVFDTLSSKATLQLQRCYKKQS